MNSATDTASIMTMVQVLAGPKVLFCTMPHSENCLDIGSDRLLVQFLMDKTLEPLSGLQCIVYTLLYPA